MRKLTLALVSIAAFAMSGCGIDDPYNDRAPARRADARETNVRDGREALERFARTWANWTTGTLAQNRRELADASTGELRDVLLRDAREVAEDKARSEAGDWSNSGKVEAVLLRNGRPALVVTREVAHVGEGGGQTSYLVYLARAELTDDGWKVVEWQPTS